jgi:hypothetical protein
MIYLFDPADGAMRMAAALVGLALALLASADPPVNKPNVLYMVRLTRWHEQSFTCNGAAPVFMFLHIACSHLHLASSSVTFSHCSLHGVVDAALITQVFDDFRPDLPFYGQPFVHAPHLTAQASKSLVFDRAYCQIAVCSPSRNSFLTGRRPNSTLVCESVHQDHPNADLHASNRPLSSHAHSWPCINACHLTHFTTP